MSGRSADAKFPAYNTARVADLVPYARNARTHSDAQVARIAASIREFGWTDPILVDGDRGVIAGHGRLLAARKLGMDAVPVIELSHLSEAQKRAYVLADNRLALDAGWDEDLLRVELGDLRGLGFDLELTGFGADEIGKILVDAAAGLTDPDLVPEAPETPSAASGTSGCWGATAWSAATAPTRPSSPPRSAEPGRTSWSRTRPTAWSTTRRGGTVQGAAPPVGPARSRTTTAPTGARPGPSSPARSPTSGTGRCTRRPWRRA
jgi:hypothetical protein